MEVTSGENGSDIFKESSVIQTTITFLQSRGGKRLLTIHKELLTIHKELLTIHKELLTIHKELLTIHKEYTRDY